MVTNNGRSCERDGVKIITTGEMISLQKRMLLISLTRLRSISAAQAGFRKLPITFFDLLD